MANADRPRSADALLEREEERTIEDLKRSLAAAGEDLPALGEVRALARRHPELTLAASAALGALLAPWIAGLARSTLPLLLRASSWTAGARSLVGLTRRAVR